MRGLVTRHGLDAERAVLHGAVLHGAVLHGAVLHGAVLHRAVRHCAVRHCAAVHRGLCTRVTRHAPQSARRKIRSPARARTSVRRWAAWHVRHRKANNNGCGWRASAAATGGAAPGSCPASTWRCPPAR
ncbi:pentapeptide repeat-containing protein [Streptomyces sp. NPDC046862]|uniref:pentapeptide repeat-containing protein n=1 Tax=Streptomyces sp. NPDC046862 TaxID=3154603 RepID=UPI0034563A93